MDLAAMTRVVITLSGMRRFSHMTAFLVLLAACEPEGTCRANHCGTIVFATVAEPSTLNPALSTTAEERDVHDLVFEKLADVGRGLVTVGDTGFVPKLAESWEREDSVTLVFHLHPEARWQDGAPVRAADVVFSWTTYTDSALASGIAANLGQIRSVTERDERTVVIRFARAYGAQFYDAVYHMRVLPSHLLAKTPRDRWADAPFSRNPIGSGPYRFVRWDAGERIVLEAWPEYYRGPPAVARLVFRPLGSFEAIVSALVAGDADATEVMMFGPLRDRLLAAPHLRAVEFDSPAYGFLAFNFRSPADTTRAHPILGDLRVRRALAMAVDRAAVVRAVLGDLGRPGVGPHTRLQWIWQPDLPHQPYDTVAAALLLADAGWVDRDGDGVRERAGRPLRLRINSLSTSALRHGFALLVQDAWRKVGVETILDEVDAATRGDRDRRGEFDVTFGAWAVDPDPSGVRQLWTPGGVGAGNWWHYESPEYARLVDEAILAPDPARARELWRASIARINDDAPALFLYELTQVAWVHDRVKEPRVRADSWWALVPSWRINPLSALPRDRVEP